MHDERIILLTTIPDRLPSTMAEPDLSGEETDEYQSTRLEAAVRAGNCSEIQRLLNDRTQALTDAEMLTVLWHAVTLMNDVEVVRMLLRHDDFCRLVRPEGHRRGFSHGSRFCVNAVMHNNVDLLRLLIDTGADPVGAGTHDIFEGCVQDGEWFNPMNEAVRTDHAECARVLLEAGGRPMRWDLAQAAKSGSSNVMLAFLQAGVDPNTKDNWSGLNLLELAATRYRPEVVSVLLRYTNEFAATALRLAVQNRFISWEATSLQHRSDLPKSLMKVMKALVHAEVDRSAASGGTKNMQLKEKMLDFVRDTMNDMIAYEIQHLWAKGPAGNQAGIKIKLEALLRLLTAESSPFSRKAQIRTATELFGTFVTDLGNHDHWKMTPVGGTANFLQDCVALFLTYNAQPLHKKLRERMGQSKNFRRMVPFIDDFCRRRDQLYVAVKEENATDRVSGKVRPQLPMELRRKVIDEALGLLLPG